MTLGNGWYSVHPEWGTLPHDSEEEAREAAQKAIDDSLGDNWHECVNDIEYGRIVTLGSVHQVDLVMAEDDDTGVCKAMGWDYRCKYELRPEPFVVEKPSSASLLLLADLVESGSFRPEMSVDEKLALVDDLRYLADEVRKGGL